MISEFIYQKNEGFGKTLDLSNVLSPSVPMDINQFESDFRSAIDIMRNRLQSIELLLEQLQRQQDASREAIQHLSQTVEEFIESQKDRS